MAAIANLTLGDRPSSTNELNEDLVVEILRRLPLKLVFRCKSVSKHWFELISRNSFVSCYVGFHATASGLPPPQFSLVNRFAGILRPKPPPPPSDSFVKLTLQEIIPWNNDFQFLAASNGFVLCMPPSGSGDVYYVVNPITRQRITLPPFLSEISEPFCRVGFLANDSTHPSFRIVRIPHADFPNHTLKLDIFSSETQHWTQSTLSFSSQRSVKRHENYECPLNYHAVALGGKLHWLHVWFASEIFVYDPYDDTETYQRLRLPGYCDGASRYCFGTCHCQAQVRKHLKYSEWNEGLIRVWELNDGLEWCLLHSVQVSEIEITSDVSHVYPGLDWPPKSLSTTVLPHVVAFHPHDRDLMLCHYTNCILQYNMRSMTLELFQEQGLQVKHGFNMTNSFFLYELPWWPTTIFLSPSSRMKFLV